VDISFKDDETVIFLLGVSFMQKPSISKSSSAQGENTEGFQEIQLGQHSTVTIVDLVILSICKVAAKLSITKYP
jgi:hypothetical protein